MGNAFPLGSILSSHACRNLPLYEDLHMHACAYVWMVTDRQHRSIGPVKGREGPGGTTGEADLGHQCVLTSESGLPPIL